MIKMSRAVRGSVSIFLVLILLPMMTYSTMIIDAVRLQSVRSSIQGAGDLALNAALSEYDVMLEEMYGLFGNVKDKTEMEAALQSYFKQTLQAELVNANIGDITEGQTEKVANDIADMILMGDKITEDDIDDFIAAQFVNLECSPIDKSAVANPAVMKQQIVEYMKYKAPISLASGLVSKLKAMNNAKTQNEAIEKKVEYEEKLSEIQEYAVKAYEAIDEAYNMGALTIDAVMENGSNGKPIIENGMEDLKRYYEIATVFYLLDANAPLKNQKVTYDDLVNTVEETIKNEGKNYSSKYKITGDNASAIVSSCSNNMSAIESEMSNYLSLPDVGKEVDDYFSKSEDERGDFKSSDMSSGGAFSKDIGIVKYNSYGFRKDSEDVAFNGSAYVVGYGESFNGNAVNSSNGSSSEKFPTFNNIQTSGGQKWFNDIRIDMPSEINNVEAIDQFNKNVELQKNYANKIFDEQKKFVDTKKGGIEQFLKYQKYIVELADAYNSNFEEYKKYLKLKFQSEEKYQGVLSEPNATKVQDVRAAWKEFLQSEGYYKYQIKNKMLADSKNLVEAYRKSVKIYVGEINGKNDVYLKYARYYAGEAFDTLAGLYVTLDYMKSSLGTASENLQKIIEVIVKLQEIEKEWQGKIDAVDSDTTKATMQSDHDQLVDQFDKKEVEALKKVVDEIIPKLETYRNNVAGVKYLEISLVNVTDIKKATHEGIEESINDGISSKLGRWAAKKAYKTFISGKVDKLLEEEGWDVKMPVQPELEKNKYITGSKGSINNIDDANNKANSLINTGESRFDCTSLWPGGIDVLRIIDGIKDDKGKAIYKNLTDDTVSAAEKTHTLIDSKDLIDDDEKFIWTLYSIAESAKMGEEEEKKEEKKDDKDKTDKPDNKDFNNAKDAADDSQKDGNKEAADDKNEKIAQAMTAISTYTEISDKLTEDGNAANKTVEVKKGKNAGKSKTNGAAGQSKGALGMIQSALNAIAEGAFMEEYFTEMFTCRTDNLRNNDEEKSLKNEVVLLNGYSSSPGNKQIPYMEEPWYGYEIEYILWGDSTLKNNYIYTDSLIFVIRFGLNLIYAFTAADINTFSLSVASAICIGPAAVAIPIVQSCIKILLALAESGIDLVQLHDGEDVPIYKSADTFVCSPTGLTKAASKKVKDIAKEKAHEIENTLIKKAEKKLNSTVDEINNEIKNKAGKTIADYKDKLKSCTEDYMKAQKDSVMSAVKSAIVQPVVTKMTSLGGEIMAILEYQSKEVVDELIEASVSEVFDTIDKNVKDMGDSVVGQILKHVMDNYRDTLEKGIAKELKDLYKPDESGNYNYKINSETLEKKIDDVLNDVLKQCNGMINKKLSAIEKDINDKISSATDKTAEEAKNFMNEKFAEASDKISGKTDELIDKAIPEGNSSGYDTQGAASGLTLNYKEYLKIFVLMKLIGSQDKMLQRSAVLVQLNVQKSNDKHNSFDITKANTLFAVRADVKMGTLFPWPVKSTDDEATGEGSLEFDFSHLGKNIMDISYCGVNGY